MNTPDRFFDIATGRKIDGVDEVIRIIDDGYRIYITRLQGPSFFDGSSKILWAEYKQCDDTYLADFIANLLMDSIFAGKMIKEEFINLERQLLNCRFNSDRMSEEIKELNKVALNKSSESNKKPKFLFFNEIIININSISVIEHGKGNKRDVYFTMCDGQIIHIPEGEFKLYCPNGLFSILSIL